MADHQPARLGRAYQALLLRCPTPWRSPTLPGLLASSLLIVLTGCNPDPGGDSATSRESAETRIPLPMFEATQKAQQQAVQNMSSVISSYLNQPDLQNQMAAQTAWIDAHQWSLRLAMINTDTPVTLDPWPMAPGFIDSLPEYPDSGIISDTTLTISADTLREQHKITDDVEVSLGLHVLEYLLFSRPAQDFVADSPRNLRRRQLLSSVVSAMEQDLSRMVLQPRPSLNVLLTHLHHQATQMHAEALSLAQDGSHSPYSGSSREDLSLQAETLRIVLSSQPLAETLNRIRPRLATDTVHTINKIALLLGSEEDDLQISESCSPLLHGLAHQFHEFLELL